MTKSKSFVSCLDAEFDNMPNKKILVVDDDADVLFTIKTVLEENQFEVSAFNTASLALQNFMPDTYSVAILDIKMPEVNGFELYERMMEIDAKVKVIFLTALAELGDYKGFKKKVFPKWGERHFVQKPIENEDLIERVKMMVVMYSNMHHSGAET
jgi:FixJ family two-component response regulator